MCPVTCEVLSTHDDDTNRGQWSAQGERWGTLNTNPAEDAVHIATFPSNLPMHGFSVVAEAMVWRNLS